MNIDLTPQQRESRDIIRSHILFVAGVIVLMLLAWLMLKEPEDARPYLEELCSKSPEIATLASLAREFGRIIRNVNGMLMLGHSGARTPRTVCWPQLPSISVVMRQRWLLPYNNPGATAQWKGMSTD